jgi:hypothetical protein
MTLPPADGSADHTRGDRERRPSGLDRAIPWHARRSHGAHLAPAGDMRAQVDRLAVGARHCCASGWLRQAMPALSVLALRRCDQRRPGRQKVSTKGPYLDQKSRGNLETRRFARAWLTAEAAGLRLPCTCGGDYWTSDNQDDREHAVELCRPCPIRRECLAGALARNECFGVWSLELTDARSGTWLRKRKDAAA